MSSFMCGNLPHQKQEMVKKFDTVLSRNGNDQKLNNLNESVKLRRTKCIDTLVRGFTDIK